MAWRIERDSLGEVEVPADRLWGAVTQRALENFPIASDQVPLPLIYALARVKAAAARAHRTLGTLEPELCQAIEQAADEIVAGRHDQEFPLVVWQTGSGTQTHMNVNEVLANRASQLLGGGVGDDRRVHPNDQVNLGQSSNDVIPTAVHVAAVDALDTVLLPGLVHLWRTVGQRADAWSDIVKTGRTHYMDATPITLGQEVGAWATVLDRAQARLMSARADLLQVALGGTAVGTGLNAPAGFATAAVAELASMTGKAFVPAADRFAALSLDDAPVAAHGAMKALAVVLIKIANDLRFLGSGPRTGIGELVLPANEPGSSIMPGKVNPTQPEAVVQLCAQVIGNDAAMAVAGTQAHCQLSVTRPHVAYLLLWSATLLGDGCRTLADRCVVGIEPDEARIGQLVERSLMLVTALTPHIGYDAAAKIAKHAQRNDLTLREAGIRLGLVSGEDYDTWIRPSAMVGRRGRFGSAGGP